MNLEEMQEALKKYGQEHIMLSYERLDEQGRAELKSQVEQIDFEECKRLFELTKQKKSFENVKLEPLEATDYEKLSEEEKEKLKAHGEEIIKNGKYAVVMLAGGQGTRLGHDGPKGTFDFGLESHKSIFEVLTEKFKEARENYGVTVPWYIMTSKDNNQATIDFFEEHNYFDYKDGIKMFFVQKEIPMIDENGKLVLNEKGLVKEGANGHGGVYLAMIEEGILDEMKKNGIEWVFICGVDNVLVKVVDPVLVGYSDLNNYKITSVSCIKANPEERVGVLAKRNGTPTVVEYTELPDELKQATKENGELLYSEAHLLMNLFNISVIEELARNNFEYHVAHKKTDYMNEDGEMVKATEPNAYKFEMLLFDAFEKLDNIGILRYKRENCFAPIKNAEGVDSPETARKLYKAYYNL